MVPRLVAPAGDVGHTTGAATANARGTTPDTTGDATPREISGLVAEGGAVTG